MSEPRKNRLSIDGGQLKDDEHVASYKPIPDSETGFRTSKSSLAKSKEKISSDGAEEKLLQKEEEAKIITRVDMADAKYVVGDHRNGDTKIELDANKRQFSGLTKEELMKYADDPFWVNLRWSLFVLFWAAWLCMLAGAIVIIVRAPKCAPPEPKKWYERGPLVEVESYHLLKDDPMSDLKLLQDFTVQGIIVDAPSYDVLEDHDILKSFKKLFDEAKEYGVKVIVELTPNFMSVSHPWFVQSENRTEPYTDYFIWNSNKKYDDNSKLQPPNNWLTTLNTTAWKFSSTRGDFYLTRYGDGLADLNFRNVEVQAQFDKVIDAWMKAGANGIRLNKARHLLVDSLMKDEDLDFGRGIALDVDHTNYAFWQHKRTTDQPGLDSLLKHFAQTLAASTEPADSREAVFTLKEEGSLPKLVDTKQNVSMLRPLPAAPLLLTQDAEHAVNNLTALLGSWPAIQLISKEGDEEVAIFSLLLPAAPIFTMDQLNNDDNETQLSQSLKHLMPLRDDATIAHGQYKVTEVPAVNSTTSKLIACARWKADHTGYVAVYNPGVEEQRANLTSLPSLPSMLTVHHVSSAVKHYTNYTNNYAERADNVLVPPYSTVVLSYVPKIEVEQ